MPDINDLLAWATANTPAPAAGTAESTSTNDVSGDNDQQLSIRFNPTSTPHAGSSALHPSDPGMPSHQALAPSDATSSGEKRSDLTSEMLDHILGKSDSLIMKEKMAIALDTTNNIDERVQALDDFEMLIEMIDNANNMAILKLWNPLLELLKSEHQPVVAHACWIIGTAVQNNPKAQAALFTFGVLPPILDIIYPPPSSTTKSYTSTRAKATYALSSALKHWPLAASALSSSSGDSSNGYSVLKRGVRDTEPVIRRKMAFLVGTLVMQDGEKYEGEVPGEVRNLVEASEKENGPEGSLVAGLKREGVFAALVEGLQEGGDDVEYDENALRALSRAAQRDGLTSEERAAVKATWAKWGNAGQAERGFEGEDAQEISKVFA